MVAVKIIRWVWAAVLLCGLPLAGAWVAGQPLGQYMEFPPLTRYVRQAPFSWPVFVAMAVGIVGVLLPFELRVWRTRRRLKKGIVSSAATFGFPRWGWSGVALTAITWVLAWTRFEWFAPFQIYTFSPLWFGYIIVVNALLYRRTGRSLLTDRPRYFLKLFVVSAVFWWFFEYLNRFVQNWYYVGIEGITPWQYFVFATLPFSTVLPAVISTYELLKSYPPAGAGLDDFAVLKVKRPRQWAVIVLVIAGAGLAGIAIWPDYLFPLLWLSPLFVITAWQALMGGGTIFSPLAEGKWRALYLAACAALICGFFWEMWNYYSVAKWIYTVPYVSRFHIFEMPVLGFAGYLPFGLECLAIAEVLRGEGDGASGP